MSQPSLFDPTPSEISQRIDELVKSGALFVINHSGGKDSQAMTAVVCAVVPASQILVVHADLGRVEWDGVQDHIRANIGDLHLEVCRNESRDLLQMVADRQQFPSPANRQCISDHKRGPIERTIRRYLKANPGYGGVVVSCMGMRAQESASRSKLEVVKKSKSNSIAGREWYDWLPIHDMRIEEVWATIKAAGQEPHPAYSLGMSRLSCCFCIMSSDADQRVAAVHNPALYAEYVALEKSTGRTMMMPRGGRALGLEAITGIKAATA